MSALQSLTLTSRLSKQTQTDANTACKMLTIRGRLLCTVIWPRIRKMTALRNQITLKAPPGEWICRYVNKCVALPPRLLTVSPTQFLLFSSHHCHYHCHHHHHHHHHQQQQQQRQRSHKTENVGKNIRCQVKLLINSTYVHVAMTQHITTTLNTMHRFTPCPK